jgi:hypothetical protein
MMSRIIGSVFRLPEPFGSEQEFDKRPISRGFPENREFGFGDGHALRLEQKVV